MPGPESDLYPSDRNAPPGPVNVSSSLDSFQNLSCLHAENISVPACLCRVPASCLNQAVKLGQEWLPAPKRVVCLSCGFAAAVLGSRPAVSQSLSKAPDAARPAGGCLLGCPLPSGGRVLDVEMLSLLLKKVSFTGFRAIVSFQHDRAV